MFKRVKELFTNYFLGSSYKKNISTMVVGRVISQAIPILLTPLLTRIYSPSEFGIFAVYSTIVSISAMISTGRYCLAIVVVSKREDAKRLVVISNIISIIVVFIIALLLSFWGSDIFSLLNVEILNQYKALLIINILVLAFFESLFYYYLKTKKYKTFAIISVIQAVVYIMLKIVWGYKINTENGLLISYLLSYLTAYILMLLSSGILESSTRGLIKLNSFKSLIKKNKKFVIFNMPADLFSMLANQSPSIFLTRFFGEANSGYFSLSEKILGAPLWFVTSSVGDVFRQESAEQYKEKGSCLPIFKKTAKGLFLLGLIPFIGIFIFLPPIIPFLFGAEWEPVGNFVRIFTVMYYAKFVVTPVSYVSYIIDKQKFYMYFQFMKFCSIILGLGIGFYTGNFHLGLILWSILLTLSYLVIYLVSYNLVKKTNYAPNN